MFLKIDQMHESITSLTTFFLFSLFHGNSNSKCQPRIPSPKQTSIPSQSICQQRLGIMATVFRSGFFRVCSDTNQWRRTKGFLVRHFAWWWHWMFFNSIPCFYDCFFRGWHSSRWHCMLVRDWHYSWWHGRFIRHLHWRRFNHRRKRDKKKQKTLVIPPTSASSTYSLETVWSIKRVHYWIGSFHGFRRLLYFHAQWYWNR